MKEKKDFEEAFAKYKNTFWEIALQIIQHPESYICKWIYLYYKTHPRLMQDRVHAFLYHYTRRAFLQNIGGLLSDKELLEREEMWERRGILYEKNTERYGVLAHWLAELLRSWDSENEHARFWQSFAPKT